MQQNSPPSKLKWKKGQGTGSLSRHLKNAHNLTKELVEAGEHERRGGLEQTQLGAGFYGQPGGGKPPLFKYDRNVCVENFADYVTLDELSLRHGESPHLVKWVQTSFHPGFQKIGRKAVKNKAIKQYRAGKLLLQQMFLQFRCRVSITSDMWTSPVGDPYICVTAHWIDDAWIMQKRIIGFQCVEERHTGAVIYDEIAAILKDFNLFDKIFSISFDNASNNKKCIEYSQARMPLLLNGRLVHIRCVAHIINLTVQEVCKEIAPLLEPVRKVVKWLRQSGQVKREYQHMCKEAGLPARRWCVDTPTRWNSTLDMLEPACNQYRIILSTLFERHYRNDDNSRGYIHQDSWEVAQHICQILSVFKEATIFFSHVYKPTIHRVIITACSVGSALQEAKSNPYLESHIYTMQIKWLSYFKTFPTIYHIAVLLSPNYKKEGLENQLEFYYDCWGHKYSFDDDVDDTDFKYDWKSDVNTALDTLEQLYDIYAREMRIENPIERRETSKRPTSFTSKVEHLISKKTKKGSTVPGQSSYVVSSTRSIINDWFSTNHPVEEDYDILHWWRQHSDAYPVLSALARDILTIPASTIASESAFSAGRRLITFKRTRLDPDTVKMLILKRDWGRADERTQEEYEMAQLHLQSGEGGGGGEGDGGTDDGGGTGGSESAATASTSCYQDSAPDDDDFYDDY